MAIPPFFLGGLEGGSVDLPDSCVAVLALLKTLGWAGVTRDSGSEGRGGGGKYTSDHPAADGGGSVKREGAGGTGSCLGSGWAVRFGAFGGGAGSSASTARVCCANKLLIVLPES